MITITRDLRLQKYRERWKSILRKLDPGMVDTEMIEDELIPELSILFNRFVEVFASLKTQMPKSVTRKKGGEVKPRDRHNFISYNYVLRKELEMRDIWEFHEEFPVPRSHTKLHALDDIMEKMCAELNLPFMRSAVIKRPKLKRK